ncbi:sensor histidine kinase [Haloarcula nitratireducens]|uniref:histidine kinase n=1 Tax=Haloarcula nitratireducens TaxID=2487749 RepID=A0AAW4PCV3_9EURY|nr:ATP-binding protein [Halomicroarcula nitratireducens]MBX0295749.1 PAS domain-containing protein [Halomicroarcula nitratireducens]
MTGQVGVLYLGPAVEALGSFLPTIDDVAVVGTVTESTDAALDRLGTGVVDCLVVDTRLPELDVASFLATVEESRSDLPVILFQHGDAELNTEGSRYDERLTDADSVAVRREAVRTALADSGAFGDAVEERWDDGLREVDERTSIDRWSNLSKQVVETSPVGIAIVVDGRITRVNRHAEDILQFSSDTGCARVTDQLSGRIYDESGQPVSSMEFHFQQILSTGPSVVGYDPDPDHADKPRHWLLVNGKPLDVGDESALVLIFKDVTKLKQHQDELERRQSELDTVVTELKRSNAELEQFAYVASHDLREPLRMVSNYLGLLERRYGDELDEDARDFIGYAVEGAQRMRRFIDDLLKYSRVGRDDDELTLVDLNDVLDDVRTDLEVRLEEADAELTVAELPVVQGNKHRLEQLFQNLVSNAIKYAGDDPPRIEIGVSLEPEQCEITVADDGVGIDPNEQEQAFDLFYTTGRDDSTGIGLALCRKIVQSHGGRIWLNSTPGEGTTIHFTLVRKDGEIERADVGVADASVPE